MGSTGEARVCSGPAAAAARRPARRGGRRDVDGLLRPVVAEVGAHSASRRSTLEVPQDADLVGVPRRVVSRRGRGRRWSCVGAVVGLDQSDDLRGRAAAEVVERDAGDDLLPRTRRRGAGRVHESRRRATAGRLGGRRRARASPRRGRSGDPLPRTASGLAARRLVAAFVRAAVVPVRGGTRRQAVTPFTAGRGVLRRLRAGNRRGGARRGGGTIPG